MNSLTLLIYLIHVADQLRGVVGGTLLITVLGFAVWLLVVGINFLIEDDDGEDRSEIGRRWFVTWLGWAKHAALPIVIVTLLITVFIPNRQTMLLMAGSQIGEKLATSDGVRSVVDPSVDLLKAWIKNETTKLVIEETGSKKKAEDK